MKAPTIDRLERRREYTRREASIEFHNSQLNSNSSDGSMSPPINVTTPPLSSNEGSSSAWHTSSQYTTNSLNYVPTAANLSQPSVTNFRTATDYGGSSAFINFAQSSSTAAHAATTHLNPNHAQHLSQANHQRLSAAAAAVNAMDNVPFIAKVF